MNQRNINKARKVFGVKTEKEAVNRALELAAIDDEIITVHQKIREKCGIEEVFK